VFSSKNNPVNRAHRWPPVHLVSFIDTLLHSTSLTPYIDKLEASKKPLEIDCNMGVCYLSTQPHFIPNFIDNPLNDPKNKEPQRTTKNPERGWRAFPTGHEKKESFVTTIGAAQLLDHYGMSMRAIVGKIIQLVS
jgi:hypothetical protein